MITDGNEWIMQGIPEDDERCIHTADELERRIEQAGFLPLFVRRLLGLGFSRRSVDGGVELLLLFFLWVSSSIFAVNAAISLVFT